MKSPTRILRVLELAADPSGTDNASVAKALHLSAEQAGATLSTMIAHGKLWGAKIADQKMPKRYFSTEKAMKAWLKRNTPALRKPTDNWVTLKPTSTRIQRPTWQKTGIGSIEKVPVLEIASSGVALGYDARVQCGPEQRAELKATGLFSSLGFGRYAEEPGSCMARAVCQP